MSSHRKWPLSPKAQEHHLEYYACTSHVLRLMDNHRQDGRLEPSALRAKLLIIRACYLINTYAKYMPKIGSHGLLESSRKHTVNLYPSNEIFMSVVQARNEAEEEIERLAQSGQQLDEDIMFLARVDRSIYEYNGR